MIKDTMLSFCTVTYNNADKITDLLNNLESVTADYDTTIYVVDNGSNDETIQIVKNFESIYDNIKLILPKVNLGFGAGNNTIIKNINSQYHIVINPDVKINSSTELDKMIMYMNTHLDIGLLSPKILNIDGSVQKLYKYNPSILDMALRFISPKIMKKRQAWFVHDETGYTKIGPIEHASGAFMFFRTDIFKKINGFDERYFMYMEDADITREVNKKSMAIFNPSFSVTHVWARKSSSNLRHILMMINSMIKYFNKWGWKWR